ncbi:hypothetical protein ENBRE01_1896 [Enteropsectra breve]|nr:hypothetical protein ENBRE01_1896 [Enteropsectra breve]
MECSKIVLLEIMANSEDSAEEILSAAVYISIFRDDKEMIMDVFRYSHEKATLQQRLRLYYLANEILKINRRKYHESASEHSSILFNLHILKFLRTYFSKDKTDAALNPELFCKYEELQEIWKKHGFIDFYDKYSEEEVLCRISALFNNKDELVVYINEISEYYRNKEQI